MQDKNVAVTCSADAIVPAWAYMLLANRLAPYALEVVFGNEEVLETVLFVKNITKMDVEQYRDQRLVLKGCGDIAAVTCIGLCGADKKTYTGCKKPDVWRAMFHCSYL